MVTSLQWCVARLRRVEAAEMKMVWAFFAKVNGEWRFEGLKTFEGERAFIEEVQKFQDAVETENGHGTSRVVLVEQ
jgi:hypothetical protein